MSVCDFDEMRYELMEQVNVNKRERERIDKIVNTALFRKKSLDALIDAAMEKRLKEKDLYEAYCLGAISESEYRYLQNWVKIEDVYTTHNEKRDKKRDDGF